ncbi:MAG: hypothetical protein ACI8RZ_006618 [Myxococcota bacterium]|jgi:hypothetical protein
MSLNNSTLTNLEMKAGHCQDNCKINGYTLMNQRYFPVLNVRAVK